MICHLVISGFVQGVGFRQFVKKTALRLGLVGWVKNIDGGRVEVLLCGSKEKIEKSIEACRKGPFLAEVKDIRVEWEQPFDKAQALGSETQARRGKKEIDFKSFEIIL
jgi:acylphosphatase